MPRGHADWNVDTASIGAYKQDNAELAARLGAANVFNRLGSTIYWELFGDDVTPWVENGNGTGWAFGLDTTQYYFKPASLKLTPGTDGNQHVFASRYIPVVETGKLGLAMLVRLHTDDPLFQFMLEVNHPDVPSKYEVRINGSDGKVENHSPDGTWNEVVDLGAFGAGALLQWFFFKLTIDAANEKFDGLQVNDQRFDLSAYDGIGITFDAPRHLRVYVYAEDTTGGGNHVNVDYVIVTIDEP